jgi:hypothetical protein
VLLAFERPDALRVEIPGPAGARLVAVARRGRLTAAFPRERAVFEGPTTPAEMEAVLAVELTPAEIMDLLVGVRPASVGAAHFRWGPRFPRRVEARLSDGTRLRLDPHDILSPATFPPVAFQPPPHQGYRQVDADEARDLRRRR